MANTNSNYIEKYVELSFNNGSESVIFSNWEVSTELPFTAGFESQLYVSENGQGLTMQNYKGRQFVFGLTPNLTATTRKKLMRLQELTSVQYQMKFLLWGFTSYVPNFPPSTTPSYTPTPVLSAYDVAFDDAVRSYANDSTDKTKQGVGLRLGLDQNIIFTVMECQSSLSLFPCAQVLMSMFDLGVDSFESSPGVWVLSNFEFSLTLAQTFIDSILFFPQLGSYWETSIPGVTYEIEKDLIGTKYNETSGPYFWATGTELTFQWTGVQLQLASGVLCTNATITLTLRVG